MLLVNQELKHRLDHAISQDGGLAVFQHYGFEPSSRAQKVNPFREERTSSFYVVQKYGKIIFKDFGDDQFKGDCRKFVQLYEQVDYRRSFEILCYIYQLDSTIQVSTSQPSFRKVAPKSKKRTLNKQKELLSIELDRPNTKELAYWKTKGNVDPDTLQENGVQAVRSFSIKDQTGRTRHFQNLNFVFAYEIVPLKAYKLYMPLAEHRVYSRSKTVFLPSLAPAREVFGETYNYSFGIDTLDPKQPFLLCAGEADCLALKSAGYNAFTLGDERSKIPSSVLDLLRQRGLNPEESSHAVLYDTDFTGLQASSRLAKQHNYLQLILPKLPKQFKREEPKPKQNDVCDYLQAYGLDVSFKVLLSQSVFQNSDYELKYTPTFYLEKHLSERVEELVECIKQYKRIQIDANAGAGKTFTMLKEIPEHFDSPILFAVPFAIQVEQIEREYAQNDSSLACFCNSKLNNMSDDAWNSLGQSLAKINICTYDRIKQVFHKMQEHFGKAPHVIIDESHLLTSEYGYRTRAIQDVLEVCQGANRVIYLSATPDYSLCKFSGFRLVRFRRRKNPKIMLRSIDYTHKPKQSILQILLKERKRQLQNPGTIKPIIVRLNNKTLAKLIAQLLLEQGLYKKGEIDFVFSEKRKGLDTPAKDSIIREAQIPEQVQLLFVTACFDCGINIQNKAIDKLINFETRYTDNCKDTFKQLIARFRKLSCLEVWNCKPLSRKGLPPLRSKERLYQSLLRDAENKRNLLPYNDVPFQETIQKRLQDIHRFGLNTPRTPRYIKGNRDISAIHKLLSWDPETNTYPINYNYIRFVLKDYERKGLCSEQFYQELSEEIPDLTWQSQDVFEPSTDKMSKELLKLQEDEKQLRKNKISLVAEWIRQQAREFFEGVYHEYCDVHLRQKIQKAFIINPAHKVPLQSLFFNFLDTYPGLSDAAIAFKDWDVTQFDEVILELSHRYFYLKDLLIPRTKIPDLLIEYADDVHFGHLSKLLNNQIGLLARRVSADKFTELIPDARYRENIHFLELLQEYFKDPISICYRQKKSLRFLRKKESLQYDVKLIKYQQRNLILTLQDLLQQQIQGVRNKSRVRDLKRRYRTLGRKRKRLELKLNKAHMDYQKSLTIGIEINELSKLVNQLRPHYSDYQGPRANYRLISSLFHTKVLKRRAYSGKEDITAADNIPEQYIVEIGQPLSFNQALAQLGFTLPEQIEYEQYLHYQLTLDCGDTLPNRAKNQLGATQSTIA